MVKPERGESHVAACCVCSACCALITFSEYDRHNALSARLSRRVPSRSESSAGHSISIVNRGRVFIIDTASGGSAHIAHGF